MVNLALTLGDVTANQERWRGCSEPPVVEPPSFRHLLASHLEIKRPDSYQNVLISQTEDSEVLLWPSLSLHSRYATISYLQDYLLTLSPSVVSRTLIDICHQTQKTFRQGRLELIIFINREFDCRHLETWLQLRTGMQKVISIIRWERNAHRKATSSSRDTESPRKNSHLQRHSSQFPSFYL